jgi:two-component system sensor histidine kinase HydH
VGSFLDYARPFRGNPSILDVGQVVARTLQLVRNDLPAQVELTVEIPPELPTVRMDPEHLRQVLLNLLRNACEAMNNRGSITLRAAARSRVSYTRDAEDAPPELVELSVRDTGPGIDPAVQRKLFIPFFTTKPSGTGLGLAICQRLVESAGGRIGVRSARGAGTSFTITLPVANALTSTDPDVTGKRRPPEAIEVSRRPAPLGRA